MGYTPAFDTLYTGTLCGRWPAAVVFASLLPLVDARGELNISYTAIHALTGWPLDLLEQGIKQLMEPDPYSRTPGEDGRRLVLIDPERPWGWRVVNHGKYREKARKAIHQAEATASGRDADRKRDERGHKNVSGDVQTRPDVSGDVRPSDSYTDSYKREEASTTPTSSPNRKGTRIPDDWKPFSEGLQLPVDFDLDGEGDRFRDYWRARAGAGGVKLDWAATWRNWARRSVDGGTYARRRGESTVDPFAGMR